MSPAVTPAPPHPPCRSRSVPPLTHPVGIHRRELLQVGFSGLLGLGLPSLLAGRAAAAGGSGRTPRSLLLIYLTGGASHLDTFDMKPDAPAEVRGEFQPIKTPVAGLHICEHLPRLAAP